MKIKQCLQVAYLGCVLDETLTREIIALKALKKINSKPKFLFRKNKFQMSTLFRMLCNALIKPHFYYTCYV